MADPLVNPQVVQELEELVQRARERGFLTLEDISQVATSLSLPLPQVLQLLSERGVKVPKELVEAEDDLDDGDEPEEEVDIEAPSLSGWGFDDELREPRLLTTPEDALAEAEHTEEVPAEVDYAPSETPAAIYLRDISRVRLLTAQEEVSLAKGIEQGNLAAERVKQLAPGSEERESLESVHHQGNDARRRLTEANLRLVVSVARKYMGRGLPLLDLIQEGNIGLQRAVEKYDYRKGYRFSTYAYWWIRQAVTRAIADQARTIRVPVHMIELIGDVYRVSRDLQQELGREPEPDEIAQEMGTSPDKVRQIIRAARQPISLETPVGEEEESTLADFIADRAARAPAEAAAQELLKEHVEDALQQLTERERAVLKMRFGLIDGRDRTLGEIGEELGVSRERVRQIEAEALQKLRQPKLRQKLREYLE
jgi:RNA polymerase primary sigma factor